MPENSVPYVQAPTTETLIRQSRRLLQYLVDTQRELERFVTDLEHRNESAEVPNDE